MAGYDTGYARQRVARVAVLVGACTVVLTASFVGVLALLSGDSGSLGRRLPLYVLVMAVVFVAVILRVEDGRRGGADGSSVLRSAAALSMTAFVLVTLSGEGMAYALRYPGRVLASELLLYFLAAGLIGTGLGYWGLNHWREYA
jgi:hypothetical protein